MELSGKADAPRGKLTGIPKHWASARHSLNPVRVGRILFITTVLLVHKLCFAKYEIRKNVSET